MRGREKLVRSLRNHTDRKSADAEAVVQLGNVVDNNPFQVELLEGRNLLFEDELTFNQETRRYHAANVIDPGDTVVLVRKRTGGEIHWIVVSVLADKTPT